MKKFLIATIGFLSVVTTLLFSSYSVTAAAADTWYWPLGKPYAGRYEEGQQFGNTSIDRDGKGHYFHDGFDFGSAIYGNGNIYAVQDGKILFAGADPVSGGSLGDFIVLQAGNINVIYQEFSYNLGDIKVSTGQTVKKGQLIGKFTSSHLHLGMTNKEWRSAHSSAFTNDGTWFNPIPVLQQTSTPNIDGQKPGEQYIFRLYNPNSGQHVYTGNLYEAKQLQSSGWNYEEKGGWVAPASGTDVYRVYNPNSGEHYYTTSSFEVDNLIKNKWKYEQVAFHSGGNIPVFTLFNPNAKGNQESHTYTTSSYERDQLVKSGWRYEKIAFYALRSR